MTHTRRRVALGGVALWICALAGSSERAVARTSVAAATSATPTGVTVEDYRSLVRRCSDAVGSDRVSPAGLTDLRRRIRSLHAVTLPMGQTVYVDTVPLSSALDAASPDDLTAAGRRIRTLEWLITPGSTGRSLPGGDPAVEARGILAAQEFVAARPHTAENDQAPGWWLAVKRDYERLSDDVSRWLHGIDNHGKPPASAPLPFSSVVAGVVEFVLEFAAVTAALVAIGLLARTAQERGGLAHLFRPGRSARKPSPADLSAEGFIDPLAAAHELAAVGNFRSAVRLTYIASLRQLETAGLLELEPNRTNWEYQRALRNRSRSASTVLLPATRLFDRIWYGSRQATSEEFSRVLQIHSAVSHLADGGPQTGDVEQEIADGRDDGTSRP